MPELFERGHIYIAVPPLYLVKLANQQTYLEKESQLDDLLVRERFPSLEIEARDGQPLKLTEARFGRFERALSEFEGWSARLRADFGNQAAEFVIGHGLVETDAGSPKDAAKVLAVETANGYELEPAASTDGLRVRIVEVETSATTDVLVPAELLVSPIYENVRRAYARLGEVLGGLPPFTLRSGKAVERAATFQALRSRALTLAKQGMQITRFKGLGEMNGNELRETTMDPSKRMLIRAEVEDAAAADLWFSRLMGDEVEPRRAFIEQNALDVRFLDV
jgi:DNA gyrase subunit B